MSTSARIRAYYEKKNGNERLFLLAISEEHKTPFFKQSWLIKTHYPLSTQYKYEAGLTTRVWGEGRKTGHDLKTMKTCLAIPSIASAHPIHLSLG